MLGSTPLFVQHRNTMQDSQLLANGTMLAFMKYNEEYRNLLTLLWTTRSFEATDPRDKIFALVRLLDDVPMDFVDYSLRLRKTLMNTAAHLLSQRSLDILSLARAMGTGLDLPTWVPQCSFVGLSPPCIPAMFQFEDLGYRFHPSENCISNSLTSTKIAKLKCLG